MSMFRRHGTATQSQILSLTHGFSHHDPRPSGSYSYSVSTVKRLGLGTAAEGLISYMLYVN